MQWTKELNALLNQCVFASGYDFAASSELFCQQAAKLRLWTGDEELELTANQCQERWMTLNPTEDDEEGKGEAEGPETQADEHLGPRASELDDTVSADNLQAAESVAVPDGGPRLELSLSEAELDMLLSTLPPSDESGDSSSADAKDRQSLGIRSEMQWVLAFLTDPDAIASVDVEAKNLMASPEKHDDDNYQVFLQDLQEANLMAPAPVKRQQQQVVGEATGSDTGVVRDDSSGEESEEEWERTRQTMKHSMKLR
ncbi:hypothetical protein PR003_g13131 [Phytophthora rubi]|uniref:Uncharacterized protein n=1 Tax=Phytophthora rubi TaxID=129364 RepID=A0A6A3MGM2_9STRA|nr:hypothetical protein PR002_g11074 [Phytophthora rubi]KAE9031651.1 hypothetical protein PR001_g10971 [Phytophthora rubi]KAE9335192.1 hypothetical protein PR003_g13131 [Phytophthora rubi]